MSEALSDERMGQIKIMAGIGHVCLQWSLLEHALLMVIAQVEAVPMDKAYLLFGSMSLSARLNLAINLLHHASAPARMSEQLKDLRKALKDRKITDRRNQAVHGVHADADDPEAVSLLMPRWGEPRREEVVTVMDLYSLGGEIADWSEKVVRLSEEVVAWRGSQVLT